MMDHDIEEFLCGSQQIRIFFFKETKVFVGKNILILVEEILLVFFAVKNLKIVRV